MVLVAQKSLNVGKLWDFVPDLDVDNNDII